MSGMTSDETCVDFLERIVCLLDNELDAGDVAEVRAHLEECAPCLQSYDLQRTVKALVARSCIEQAPGGPPAAGAGPDPADPGHLHRGLSRLSALTSKEPPTGSPVRGLCAAWSGVPHALGRLPWLAAFFLRPRRLRPVLPMVSS